MEPLSHPVDNHLIHQAFPTPIYIAHRERVSSPIIEEDEIKQIINYGMYKKKNVSTIFHIMSNDDYIFNTKLNELKEFCEEQIKKYVKEVMNPREEIDFYITQSWLNVIAPGETSPSHLHPNSILSGVYYVTTVEEDHIVFHDPNSKIKRMTINAEPEIPSHINSDSLRLPINTRDLLLFPSWLEHGVLENPKATSDRISIAFNTFAKGKFGGKETLSELIL